MMELIRQYNLKQLINELTHFTESTASLIDLIVVRNKSNILTSGVMAASYQIKHGITAQYWYY